MAKVSRKKRGEQQERIKKKYGAGSKEHLAAIKRTQQAASESKAAKVDTAAKRSPDTYRPDVKVGGKNTFYGTNIPTAGYTSNEIADFNARLKEDVDAGNSRGANDVIFSIAHARGGGEGNKRVGAVQSGMWKLDKGNLWAEDNINSTNDRYVIRDEKGKPTGQEVRFSDQHGVVKGKDQEWTPIGSWGENARAGIVEGQPTAAPPPSGTAAVPIVDLDTPGGRVIAGPGAGTRPGAGGGVQGPYSPGGRLPAGGGGFLGGGGYPVMGMGTPSGASYPAAQQAAQGWAGQLGFNIDERGGLALRPWEAASWQQSGIDPNLWNAPFAGGGLLGGQGGGYPGGGQPGRGRPGTGGPITIPGGDTAAPTTPTARKDWWPNGATNDQMATWMNQTGGSPLDWANSLYTLDEQKTGFGNLLKTGNIWGDVGDRARTAQDYQPLTTQAQTGAEPGRPYVPPVAGTQMNVGRRSSFNPLTGQYDAGMRMPGDPYTLVGTPDPRDPGRFINYQPDLQTISGFERVGDISAAQVPMHPGRQSTFNTITGRYDTGMRMPTDPIIYRGTPDPLDPGRFINYRPQHAAGMERVGDISAAQTNPAETLSLIDQWNLSRNNPLVETFADIPGGAVAPTIPYVAPNYGLLT